MFQWSASSSRQTTLPPCFVRVGLRGAHSASSSSTRARPSPFSLPGGIFSLRAEKRRVSCCGVRTDRATRRTRATPCRNQPRHTRQRLMRKTKPLISATLIRWIYRVSLLSCGGTGREPARLDQNPELTLQRRITGQWRFICGTSGGLWADVYLSQPEDRPLRPLPLLPPCRFPGYLQGKLQMPTVRGALTGNRRYTDGSGGGRRRHSGGGVGADVVFSVSGATVWGGSWWSPGQLVA